MTAIQFEAISRIKEQQSKYEEITPQWMVGEQLKEICEAEPDSAELILRDLYVPEMSLAEAEKKIKAWADKNRKGGAACVPPNKAEEILRDFYGLGGKRGAPAAPSRKTGAGLNLDLSDFL